MKDFNVEKFSNFVIIIYMNVCNTVNYKWDKKHQHKHLGKVWRIEEKFINYSPIIHHQVKVNLSSYQSYLVAGPDRPVDLFKVYTNPSVYILWNWDYNSLSHIPLLRLSDSAPPPPLIDPGPTGVDRSGSFSGKKTKRRLKATIWLECAFLMIFFLNCSILKRGSLVYFSNFKCVYWIGLCMLKKGEEGVGRGV